MKTQNKNKIRIEIDKHNFKVISKVLGAIFLILVVISLFQYILIPLAIGLTQGFIGLCFIYLTLSLELQFFGGFIFLFIGYKILVVFVEITSKIIYWIKELMK
jgi:hypothetical protein